MGFTKSDIKIIVSTLFSAIIGVAIANALTCAGNQCSLADAHDVLIACSSIILFLVIFYFLSTDREERRRKLYERRGRSRSSRSER